MLTETTLPSDIDLPKAVDKFRNYEDSNRHDVVSNHYKLMRTHQTLDFVNKMLEKYSFQKPRQRMTIQEAFKKLEHYVDCSDPDVRCVLNVRLL
jgi:inositol oxygenase